MYNFELASVARFIVSKLYVRLRIRMKTMGFIFSSLIL
jgi:hypothetical protein